MGSSQHIGVLAGEKSGDILGGAVLRGLSAGILMYRFPALVASRWLSMGFKPA